MAGAALALASARNNTPRVPATTPAQVMRWEVLPWRWRGVLIGAVLLLDASAWVFALSSACIHLYMHIYNYTCTYVDIYIYMYI